MSDSLYTLARRVIAACEEKARTHGLPIPTVDVRLGLRGRSASGTCTYSPATGRAVVNLNAGYFALVGDRYAQTIAHEYAHAVVFEGKRVGRFPLNAKPHGGCWSAVMKVLGYTPSRTTTYAERPEAARKTAQYRYVCEACGGAMLLGAQRHSRAQKGTRYIHACPARGRLTFVGGA